MRDFTYAIHENDNLYLDDDRILHDMDEAKTLYEDGSIVEAADILTNIVNAIHLFDLRNGEENGI